MAHEDPMRAAALLIADIYEVAGRLRRTGDAVARAAGQSQARWQVLSVISEGRWTVPRIADRLGVTRQNVQRLVDELCGDGSAEFMTNDRHARSPFVVPTQLGRQALATLTGRAEALDRFVVEAVGAKELDRVQAALRRLLGALRATEGTDAR